MKAIFLAAFGLDSGPGERTVFLGIFHASSAKQPPSTESICSNTLQYLSHL